MKIAIRADASLTIGSGHIARCLTLASKLRDLGAHLTFLCQSGEGSLLDLVRASNFSAISLGYNENVVEAEDAELCLKVLGSKVDCVIVDHYQLGKSWENLMHQATGAIMVIEDQAIREHSCEILLDQNASGDDLNPYCNLVPASCHCLLGTHFVLLRDEFKVARQALKPSSGSISRVLISFGGSDPLNLTEKALRGVMGLNESFCGDVVIGQGNPHQVTFEKLCQQSRGKWQLHVQTTQMAQLMQKADLAIGAGGTTHWERCLLGLPALIVTVADNQVKTTRLLSDQGACLWLGDGRSFQSAKLKSSLQQLIDKPQLLEQMAQNAYNVVPDAGGAERVAAKIYRTLGKKENTFQL